MREPEKSSPLEERNPNDRRILGSDDFAAKLLDAAWRAKSRKSVEQLIEEECRKFSVTIEQLNSPKGTRDLVEARP
jgi:chromosomal replication initiation ATPase DnaA